MCASVLPPRLHARVPQDAASMYSLRGLLAHREKKLDQAVKYMSRAIRLAPEEAR